MRAVPEDQGAAGLRPLPDYEPDDSGTARLRVVPSPTRTGLFPARAFPVVPSMVWPPLGDPRHTGGPGSSSAGVRLAVPPSAGSTSAGSRLAVPAPPASPLPGPQLACRPHSGSRVAGPPVHPARLWQVLRQALEVLDGRRSVGQLRELLPQEDCLALERRLDARRAGCRHVLRRLRTCYPTPTAVEVAAVIVVLAPAGREGVLAAAGRFEQIGDRWPCTVLRLV